MDEYYDCQAAVNTLNVIMEERQRLKPDVQLATMRAEYVNNFTLEKTTYPTCWRILRAISSSEKQELVMRIQGVISLKELPPMHLDTKKINDIKFLRQGVQLTGLNASGFNAAIANISVIFSEFSRHFPDGDLHIWKPDSFLTNTAINVYNRYFYSSNDCPNQTPVPFGNDIDPNNTLSALGLAAGLVHTTDNQVQYFKLVSGNKFTKTPPTIFRVGDIVELHFSTVIIPVKQKKFQMILVLRGLALIDSSIATLAHTKRIAQIAMSDIQVPSVVLKRKSIYDDDEGVDVQEVKRASRETI